MDIIRKSSELKLEFYLQFGIRKNYGVWVEAAQENIGSGYSGHY